MISLERLDKAIEKIEAKIKDIPPDELVPDNKDYVKWERLLQGFKRYKESFVNLDKLMNEIGV